MSYPSYPMMAPCHNMVHDIFQRVDHNRSGLITANELQSALSNGSWKPFNPETVRLLMGMFDRNGNGTLNFDEFSELWKYVSSYDDCFKSFDRDRSGSIDRNELRNAINKFGFRISEETLHAMARKYDRQRRGVFYFDDFIQCCVALHDLTQAYKRLDGNMDGIATMNYDQFLTVVFRANV